MASIGSGSSSRSGHSLWSAALVLAIGLGIALPAASESKEGGAVFGYELAHELMSPFCPGRTLAACTSEQAAEMRQWILLQEAAGATREEVIAVLESKYGEQIRSSPVAEGWGLAAWLLPGSAVAVGALVAIFSLRRLVATSRRRADRDAIDAPAPPRLDAATGEEALLERLIDAEFAETRR